MNDLKAVMTKTHTNTHNPLVCTAADYTQFVTELIETRDFHVDGRQFRLWAELLPPTEANPDDDRCTAPPDDPRTPFNETALFNMSMTGYHKGKQVVFPYHPHAKTSDYPYKSFWYSDWVYNTIRCYCIHVHVCAYARYVLKSNLVV